MDEYNYVCLCSCIVQVFCGVIIVMGIIMAVWGCMAPAVSNSTCNHVTSSQVVTVVPANSAQLNV